MNNVKPETWIIYSSLLVLVIAPLLILIIGIIGSFALRVSLNFLDFRTSPSRDLMKISVLIILVCAMVDYSVVSSTRIKNDVMHMADRDLRGVGAVYLFNYFSETCLLALNWLMSAAIIGRIPKNSVEDERLGFANGLGVAAIYFAFITLVCFFLFTLFTMMLAARPDSFKWLEMLEMPR